MRFCSPASRAVWPLAALTVVLTGCGREEVRYYPNVPKESGPAFAQKPAPNHDAMHLEWTVPPGWKDKGASGMRAGSFAVDGSGGQSADVSVIALSSWAGRELENVNRWRAQVGLQPIAESELPANTTTIEIGGAPGQLFEFAGTPVDQDKKVRILAAALPLPGLAWFFKMTGDDALVLAQKPVFMEFLKSVQLPRSQAR